MHIHILGICGTFMAGIAVLAKELGHVVTGSDQNIYPPMSDVLAAKGIDIYQGYDEQQFAVKPDQVVIGNAMSRGNPAVEYVLNNNLNYVCGPQWLSEHVLQGRWVAALSGTHGKTTTTAMLTWILEFAGKKPGFLIGGVAGNFDESARLGDGEFFVVEADEYDSAFFDKRSKFVHYRPRTLVINNLEYDHADIFPDMAAIQTQFHHLVRTVPENGLILSPPGQESIEQVLEQGCWTPRQTVGIVDRRNPCAGANWQAKRSVNDGSSFGVWFEGKKAADVSWNLCGDHNLNNGLMAIASAHHMGISIEQAAQALSQFGGVKRRMELLASIENIHVYDDFAHHPTAIKTTLEGLRAKVGSEQICAVIEPRSNTMQKGIHQKSLKNAFAAADEVIWHKLPAMEWDLQDLIQGNSTPMQGSDSVDRIIEILVANAKQAAGQPRHFILMSNGGFDGIHTRLIKTLETQLGAA
ncbi:MAG: UDP-N-acetylmuramate:L-alanyl-gamma-D-glutamyl-meso-diaminopimelate ligase [Pseudomonadales bacterium]|nr:UDP-N-acetylmuramate:L-alanyl-gamma-D-glutamyl-meso-diaminopimelate ligase [Pseudomonadales bacterium]